MEELLDDFDKEEKEVIKSRHGCVTTYLVLMIIVNSITALTYFSRNNSIPNISNGLVIVLGIIGTLNVIFAVLLLQYKKIGFYGFVVSSIITFVLNTMIGIDVGKALLGLVGIAIFYAILQIKQDNNSAWQHLE